MVTEHPWIASYPPGVCWDTPLPARRLHEMLDAAVQRWPEHFALDFMGRRLRYRELAALVRQAACGLQRLGVGPGVHVGLYLPNTPHFVIAFFAVLVAGGVVVNYSPLDAERVLAHKIEDSQTDILITLDLAALYPQMRGLLDSTRLRRLVVGSVAEMAADPAAVQAGLMASGQSVTVDWRDARLLPFAALLDNDGVLAPVAHGAPADTLAILQYTGGTTGQPKGAMLTHGNVSAAVQAFAATASGEVRLLTPGADRILTVLPLFHIYALAMNMVFGLYNGAELILHMRFDLEAVLADLVGKRVTMFPAVPTMYTAMIHRPGVDQLDFSALRFCVTGGAPVPLAVNQRFEQLTGCRLYEGWGLTETAPAGTFTPVVGARKPGACGVPAPGLEMRFLALDDATRVLPLGQTGEIAVRGPNVMAGYWRNPEATAAVMTADGFLRTGDVGWMDADGFLHIVDRTKDMILCSGYNVYPRVLEEAIHRHPAVAEVAVIGIDDPYRGQSPKAFVVLKPGAAPFTLAELQHFLKDQIGKHEMVQALALRDDLPKTPVGKLSKQALIAQEARAS